MKAEQITDPVAYHGEGPVWSASWGGLRWVDMLAGDVLSFAPDGSIMRKHVGKVAAALRPRRQGGAVIGVERGFALEDADGTHIYLDELWSGESVRMNEGACDPDGCFYCGSMAYDKHQGGGTLYRLNPDRSVQVVLEHVTISNGLDWSPDGSLAYYNDTPTHRVSVFDYDREAGLTKRRMFVEIPPEIGRPDGLTVDSQGGVWVALYAGSAVHRYTPEGVLDEVIELPVPRVTACALGGPRLDQLFITTSREGAAPGTELLGGALFRADVGVAGKPVLEFAG